MTVTIAQTPAPSPAAWTPTRTCTSPPPATRSAGCSVSRSSRPPRPVVPRCRRRAGGCCGADAACNILMVFSVEEVAGSVDPQLPGSKVDDAFEEFVRGRSTDLFRLALVLTGWDKAAAEDVLQVALERAFRRWRALVRDGAPEPYVRRVVVNAALDWRRAVRRRREGALDIAAGMTVEDRTDQIGDSDAVVRVLAALAPKQRAVLVMRYWV